VFPRRTPPVPTHTPNTKRRFNNVVCLCWWLYRIGGKLTSGSDLMIRHQWSYNLTSGISEPHPDPLPDRSQKSQSFVFVRNVSLPSFPRSAPLEFNVGQTTLSPSSPTRIYKGHCSLTRRKIDMGNSASTKQPARERGSSAAELAENSERGSSGSERPSFSEKTSSMKRLGSKKKGVVDHTPGVECVKHYQVPPPPLSLSLLSPL
jgi:hypothetical protein